MVFRRREVRRALSKVELTRLLETTLSSLRVTRRLTGEDRCWLYVVATSTGFRAGELASLTPRSFVLDADRPVVYLRPVWPGTWRDSPLDILRSDLVAADIPSVVEGPGGVPLDADMHSMRHTFIRMLDLAGTSLKEAMQLARHSDPKLTTAVYGQAGTDELAAKLDAVGAVCFPSASFLLPFRHATG